MRVLHVYKEYHPHRSGVARHIAGIVQSLKPLGIAAAVFAFTSDAKDVELHQGGWWRLVGAIRTADIVHVHGARVPVAIIAAGLAGWFGRPVLYTPHCYYDHGSWSRRRLKRLWDRLVEPWLIRRACTIVQLDQSWIDDARRRGWPTERMVVLPNCVLAARLPPPIRECGRLAGRPALLSISRLDPVKRLGDAIASLSHPGLEQAILHLVGVGAAGDSLRQQAVALGVAERVVFHGWLDDPASQALLAACDLFLLPSEREGLPTAMLEALAAGVPVLASDIAGNRAIGDAVGWEAWHTVGDVAALAAGIRRWAGAPVPPTVCQAIRDRFTWEARIGELAQLYRQSVLSDGA